MRRERQKRTFWKSLTFMDSVRRVNGRSWTELVSRKTLESMLKILQFRGLLTVSPSYTYEVCLFNEAKQKPNKGGQSFSLGYATFHLLVFRPPILYFRKFSSWNPSSDVKPGEPEYYQKQVYNRGAKCWNGPERSVVVRPGALLVSLSKFLLYSLCCSC